MKQVQLAAHGVPEQVVRCNEVPDVGAPGPGEVVFDVLAFPINAEDIAFRTGHYRLKPPLPATPGANFVDLGHQMLEGKLDAPVAAVYPIERIAATVAHAQRGAKGRKILVAPNAPV